MLRISRQTDYGVFLMTLFAREKPGTLISASELDERTPLPLPMISKILKGLVRKGILDSKRGVQGGYFLARAPERLKVGEIIEAIDGPIAITECMEEDCECRFRSVCPMHSNWSRINRAIQDALMQVSLAEMCNWEEEQQEFPLEQAFAENKGTCFQPADSATSNGRKKNAR